jgi:AcrR family transcriptional regulator
VRQDILDATIALLSERPLHDVSVRDIATRAGVQHSLVTRHFGSKDALIAHAVATVASEYAGAVAATDDDAAGYLNALRHLEGRPFTAFVLTVPSSGREGETAAERFPGFAAHLEWLRAAGAPDDLHTRVAAGMALGMVAAWNLMQGLVLDATGIDPSEAAPARVIAESMVAEFVAAQLTHR